MRSHAGHSCKRYIKSSAGMAGGFRL